MLLNCSAPCHNSEDDEVDDLADLPQLNVSLLLQHTLQVLTIEHLVTVDTTSVLISPMHQFSPTFVLPICQSFFPAAPAHWLIISEHACLCSLPETPSFLPSIWYRNMKSENSLRTGNPDLLILTVSIIPEYFNCARTVSGKNLSFTFCVFGLMQRMK